MAASRNRQVIVRSPPVVLGLDFGGTKIAIAVCDLAGNRLASMAVSTDAAPGVLPSASARRAPAIFSRGVAAARELLGTAAPGSELVAVGAATFGIPFDDRVELAPAIDGWESFPLGRELRAAFAGAAIRMATDAKAAAAAELRWGVLAGCDPGVYLNLGTGLAAAIVIGGQVVDGGNGAAGEIGYNLRSISDVGQSLDRRVPLEGMVSGLGLARHAGGTGPGSTGPDGTGPDGTGPGSTGPGSTGPGSTGPGSTGPDGTAAAPPMTAAEIFAASPGNPELAGLLSDFIGELSFHLVNLAIFLNPVRIAVGGGMVGSWEKFRPQLAHALSAGVPYPPELVLARFPYDAPLLGAVALAVEAAQGLAADGHIPHNAHIASDTVISDTVA